MLKLLAKKSPTYHRLKESIADVYTITVGTPICDLHLNLI